MKTQIEILKEYQIPVRGHQGQHILVDPNVQRNIVDLLDLTPGDYVLEIGPGLGALTGEMLERGASVLAVEKDPRFVNVLRDVFKNEINEERLSLVHEDILKVDLPGLLGEKRNRNIRKVVSNLPYYITGPSLFHVFPAC